MVFLELPLITLCSVILGQSVIKLECHIILCQIFTVSFSKLLFSERRGGFWVSVWVVWSQPVTSEPPQVTELHQEAGLFYSSHTVHSDIMSVSSLLWIFFSAHQVILFTTACSLLYLKCGKMRSGNLNKLRRIPQGFAVYAGISTHVAHEQIL